MLRLFQRPEMHLSSPERNLMHLPFTFNFRLMDKGCNGDGGGISGGRLQTNPLSIQIPNQRQTSLPPEFLNDQGLPSAPATPTMSRHPLERVITTSKMAALQARRGSNTSLANLKSSLMESDNPRRGSAVGDRTS